MNFIAPGEFLFQIALQAVGRHANFLEQFGHQAFGLADECQQQMFAIQFLVRMFPGQPLRVLQRFRRFLRQLVELHKKQFIQLRLPSRPRHGRSG